MRDDHNTQRRLQPDAAPVAAPAPRHSPRAGSARRAQRRRHGQLIMLAAVFTLSVLPALTTKLKTHATSEVEQRKLAELPTSWEGPWHALDKNYARFEHWFADSVGMRNEMIRFKNELDYRLFRSSSRVYFGANGELFNRHHTDDELPATEAITSTPRQRSEMLQGLTSYARKLKEQGVTMVLVPAVAKHYYVGDRLPWHAPRLPQPSNFMQFYSELLKVPELNTIDVDGIQRAHERDFPIYFRQDFHWTDVTAMTVAAGVVERIAQLEGSPLRWKHERKFAYLPFVGSEARFATRLRTNETLEPQLTKTWTDRERHEKDVAATGLEFDTDMVNDPGLLPSTCVFGNSFSDGMLRAGLPEHFQQFTKISRNLSLTALPALAESSHCKYLVVQILDTQGGLWLLR
jgi:alginate O-acetyltransferase complex protein AlgJ